MEILKMPKILNLKAYFLNFPSAYQELDQDVFYTLYQRIDLCCTAAPGLHNGASVLGMLLLYFQ